MNVEVKHVDGLRYLATADTHSVVIDMTREAGGINTAFSADELFAAALGACALNFVANSCHLHNIPANGLRVEVELNRVEHPQRLGDITLKLALDVEITPDQQGTLLGVAKHCILANTLARPPQVTVLFETGDAAST